MILQDPFELLEIGPGEVAFSFEKDTQGFEPDEGRVVILFNEAEELGFSLQVLLDHRVVGVLHLLNPLNLHLLNVCVKALYLLNV